MPTFISRAVLGGVLALTSAAGAADLFDIPSAASAPPKARVSQWGAPITSLIDIHARDAQLGGLPATLRVGWEGSDLLVYADVEDQQPASAESPDTLWMGDCLEVFLGRADKPDYRFQILCAPDYEKPNAVKLQVLDSRGVAGLTPPACHATREPRENGYRLSLRIPLTSLGLTPEPGTRLYLQLAVDEVNERKERKQYVWYPSPRSSADGKAARLVRLGRKSDDSTDANAIAEYRGFRDALVVVAAPASLAGRKVRVMEQGHTLATSQLKASGERSTARLVLPRPAAATSQSELSFKIDGRAPAPLAMPPVPDLKQAADELRFRAKSCIFWEKTFPVCDFEHPLDAEDLLGAYTIQTTYYDGDLNSVTEADKPGRYAAVCTITSESGQSFKRYVALYRTPAKVALDWWGEPLPLSVELPPEFGIDPAVVKREARPLADALTGAIREQAGESDEWAMVLAALAEMKADGAASVGRSGPWGKAEDYFSRLRLKLEDFRYPYAVSLPKDYVAGDKVKRPMILFLHGSGERGTDIKRIENNLVAQNVRKNNLPFIVVTPQCPPAEWWNALLLDRLINETAAKYNADPDRIYVTGLSMGGFGSWSLAHRYPDRFAAVAPICGIGDRFDMMPLKNLPLWVFHGDQDTTVPLDPDVRCVEALKAIGGRVRMTVYPGVGHNSWTATYNNPELYSWFLQQRRGAPQQAPAAAQ